MTTRRRATAIVAAVLALVIAVLLVASDGDDDPGPGAGTSTSTTSASSTTTTSTTTVPAELRAWPAPTVEAPADPEEAATRFAVELLGFVDPQIGAFLRGDSRSGEVEVRPTADGPVTTVLLRQLSGDEGWSVLGASSANIELTSPAVGDTLSGRVVLEGRALAFEGTVDVEVVAHGSTAPLATGFVTGGGDVARPFVGEIDVPRSPAATGALVLRSRSAEDGRTWEASVIAVRFATS